MKLLHVVLKDLRLVLRDRAAVVGLLLVPLVVIVFVAESQSSARGAKKLILPIVNEDQGPVAHTLIEVLKDHAEVRVLDRVQAEHLVRDEHRSPAVMILPEGLSKRYLTERKSTIELETDPAQWAGLEAVRVLLLLADREAASIADPFKEELIEIHETSITAKRLKFSSLEQNVPGFSIMFVLLSLVYGIAFGLRDEEAWGTSRRMAIAPVSQSALLGGKTLARALVAFVQLGLLLVFGHFVYHVSLGAKPWVLVPVVAAIALSMSAFSVIIAALARTREQILPVGLAAVFVLATLGGCFWPYASLPPWMQIAAKGAITTWSMSSLLDVMLRDRGFFDILPNLGVMLGIAVLSFAIGVRLFRYSEY